MDSEIFRLVVLDHFEKGLLETVVNEVNSRSSLLSTPLHYAMLGCNQETTQFLIENKAQVNASNVFGETPLHWACKVGKETLIRYLLTHQASPSEQDTEGNTPMHWAAEYDHENAIHLLS